MNLRESVRIGWRAITGHKLRSTLTTLGVIIGIASVIVFMVLGGAFTEDVLGDIEEENEPVMQVITQTDPEIGAGIQFVQSPIYTESDVESVEEIDGVEYVVPNGDISAVQLAHDGESVTGGFSATATTAEQFESGELYTIEEGEAFSAEDEAVVNTHAAAMFEGNLSPGDEIAVNLEDGSTIELTVSGIAEDDVGDPTGPTVYVPLDPHYTLTVETPDGGEERAFPSLLVLAEDIDAVDAAQEEVADYFENDAHARELKNDDYEIRVQTLEDAIEQFTGFIDQLTVFIGGIAAISLVVGSIGIANIMIVSVTERTREIGIMKAVGARKRDVVQLFLVESVILGAIGAVFGVALGLGIGYLAVGALGWPMAYPIDWILIAVVVGVGVGIVSGLYPAWRAANVDPIEALRRE